jgi:hypothetical protein
MRSRDHLRRPHLLGAGSAALVGIANIFHYESFFFACRVLEEEL